MHPDEGRPSDHLASSIDGVRIAVVLFAVWCASCAAAAIAAGGPPVIREPWTPLPCPAHARTTVAIEGCLERQVSRSDGVIDEKVAAIFTRLRGANRTVFAGSERDWLSYRRKSCLATASAYVGGSAEPLVFLRCEQGRNVRHIADLKVTASSLAHR
jgi:uncharacterized protein YecT (DUF1311 family)